MGLSFTIAAGPRKCSHSHIRVSRDSWPHFTVSGSKFPQPGGPRSRIYFPQEHSGPVITPGNGFPFRRLLRLARSQSHIATDDQPVSKSWCRAPSGAYDHIFITVWHLLSCFREASSLTRGRVCPLYMLLALASAVFLGSKSLGTRDHILLSQIWDFLFLRLLRLAGSRWRYSTTPPHG
jgi:hypothetical protein